MSKNYAIIIQFVLPLTTFYRSGAQKSNVYKRDAFVTSWRFHNRAWQPQRHDRLPETSGTLWIHRGALTNQRCSLATGCGIKIWANHHSNLSRIDPTPSAPVTRPQSLKGHAYHHDQPEQAHNRHVRSTLRTGEESSSFATCRTKCGCMRQH